MDDQDVVVLGKRSRRKVHEITGIQVQRLIAKLSIINPFLPRIALWEILIDQDYNEPGEANNDGGKHVLQEASIIGHLRRINALSDTTVRAIELGAGTGRLSDRLQRSTNARLDHVLIDRQEFAPNHCRDRILKARCAKVNCNGKGIPIIKRIVVDIGLLKLQDYIVKEDEPTPTTSARKTLCCSKHLCGPACDLALQSLQRCAIHSHRQSLSPPPSAIATCCHYLCTFESFVGRDFWKGLGLTQEDFMVATAVSQWSSLQPSKKKKKQSTKEENSNDQVPQPPSLGSTILPNLFSLAKRAKEALEKEIPSLEKDFVPSEEFEKTFTRQEKAKLGMQLKELLDLSRAASCQQMGYEKVELIRYTTRSVEDRLLLLY